MNAEIRCTLIGAAVFAVGCLEEPAPWDPGDVAPDQSLVADRMAEAQVEGQSDGSPATDVAEALGAEDAHVDSVGAECVASCEGKECGENGCDGSCGTCSMGESCLGGSCEMAVSAFYDDFSMGLSKWDLWGQPQPTVLGTVKEKQSVFDNNGDGTCDSGTTTKEKFDLSAGFVLSALCNTDVTNAGGCWLSNFFGVGLRPQAEDPCSPNNWSFLIYGGVDHVGYGCWGSPAEISGHAYLHFGMYADGTAPWMFGDLIVDDYLGGWHVMTLVVRPELGAEFYLDDVLVHSTDKKVDAASLKDLPVSLFGRSSGYSGKAYVDHVHLQVLTK